MKKIQVLGTGCPKCKTLTAHVEQAMQELGLAGTVEKVTDLGEIMNYGVMLTPALALDGKVKSVGKVLSVQDIKSLLA